MKIDPEIQVINLPNGLTLIIEEMPWVQSVAYDLIVPGGIAHDPEQAIGASLVLAELTSRGAGERTSRELSDLYDLHGIRRSESAGLLQSSYRGVLLEDKLPIALELLSDIVRKPTLPEDEIPSIRDLLLQDIRSLSDNPARLAMHEASARYFPGVHGRSGLGTEDGLTNVDVSMIQNLWKERFGAKGSILSIAGNVSTSQVVELVQHCFGEWSGAAVDWPEFEEPVLPSRHHMDQASAQEQIILFFPSVKFLDQSYYEAKIVSNVLSGGMFGRLFVEVRDKKGLCYSVYARHSGGRDYGLMSAYAGTTPERADETLLTMLEVFRSMRGSVTTEELERAQVNLRAHMVMGSESSRARASANASDFYLLKRVRSLSEIEEAIHQVTLDSIENYLSSDPFKDYLLFTLGARDIAQEVA